MKAGMWVGAGVILCLMSPGMALAVPKAASLAVEQSESGAVARSARRDVVDQEAFTAGPNETFEILLADGTSLTLAAGARLNIERYRYDRTTLLGELSVAVESGAVRVVGGVLNNSGAMTINVPGGQGLGDNSIVYVEVDGAESVLSLMLGKGLTVDSPKGSLSTGKAGESLVILPDGTLSGPRKLAQKDAERLAKLFNPGLATGVVPVFVADEGEEVDDQIASAQSDEAKEQRDVDPESTDVDPDPPVDVDPDPPLDVDPSPPVRTAPVLDLGSLDRSLAGTPDQFQQVAPGPAGGDPGIGWSVSEDTAGRAATYATGAFEQSLPSETNDGPLPDRDSVVSGLLLSGAIFEGSEYVLLGNQPNRDPFIQGVSWQHAFQFDQQWGGAFGSLGRIVPVTLADDIVSIVDRLGDADPPPTQPATVFGEQAQFRLLLARGDPFSPGESEPREIFALLASQNWDAGNSCQGQESETQCREDYALERFANAFGDEIRREYCAANPDLCVNGIAPWADDEDGGTGAMVAFLSAGLGVGFDAEASLLTGLNKQTRDVMFGLCCDNTFLFLQGNDDNRRFVFFAGFPGSTHQVDPEGSAFVPRAGNENWSADRFVLSAGLDGYDDGAAPGSENSPNFNLRGFLRSYDSDGDLILRANLLDQGLFLLNPGQSAYPIEYEDDQTLSGTIPPFLTVSRLFHSDFAATGSCNADDLCTYDSSTLSLTLGSLSYRTGRADSAAALGYTLGTTRLSAGGGSRAVHSPLILQAGGGGDPVLGDTGRLGYLVLDNTGGPSPGGQERVIGSEEENPFALLRLAVANETLDETAFGSRTSRTIGGYVAGALEVDAPGTSTDGDVALVPLLTSRSNLVVTTDAEESSVQANLDLDLPTGSGPLALSFGGDALPSALLDDDRFAAFGTASSDESGTQPLSALASTGALVGTEIPDGNVARGLPHSNDYDYLEWGFFFGDVAAAEARYHAHLVPWVAGDLSADTSVLPQGSASYTGQVVGNVFNAAGAGAPELYTASGTFSNSWNFATGTAEGTMSLDGLSYRTEAAFAPGSSARFDGFVIEADGPAAEAGTLGALHGSFVRGGQGEFANHAGQIGAFSISGHRSADAIRPATGDTQTNYSVIGVFGAERDVVAPQP